MRDEYCTTDALRSFFAGMRAELDTIIDGEIARLYAASPAARTPIASETCPIEVCERRTGPSGDGEERPMRPAMDMTSRTATNPASSLAPPIRPGLADDAGSRLDALARRLEGRLNRPRRRAGEPISPAERGNAGDERIFPSTGRA